MGWQRPAGQADRQHHRYLDCADQPEHDQLGQQVGARRQASRPFPAVDRAFLHQFPHRVGRAREASADGEHQQQGHRVGIVGAGQSLRRRHGPDQQPEYQWQDAKHAEVDTVRGDDSQVPAAQRAQLREPVPVAAGGGGRGSRLPGRPGHVVQFRRRCTARSTATGGIRPPSPGPAPPRRPGTPRPSLACRNAGARPRAARRTPPCRRAPARAAGRTGPGWPRCA